MGAELDKFALITGLFGGLALFLFGMDLMTAALKRVAGEQMKDLLGKVTGNRLLGAGMGALVTGLVNSSSVTTVILVGFISAGLMTTAQSISVIMGANIGSTLTAQILAFNVTRFSLPMITLGFFAGFLLRRQDWQDYGRLLLGLGLVFYGMGLMSAAMLPLRTDPAFVAFIAALRNPALALLAGTVFTAIIQSSAATTGIVIVLAGHGMMTLETAIAVAMGANIGTCATAILASIGKPRDAVRAAVVHVLFNIGGALIWIGLIDQLAAFARWISPSGDVPREIANAHTVFNVANTALLIGFTTQIARLVQWLVPDKPQSEEAALTPKYLNAALLSTPAFALQNARREIGRVGYYVADMLGKALPAALSGSRRALEDLEALHAPVDRLHRAIIDYLGRISLSALSDDQSRDLMQLVSVANDLEHVAERIAADITASARKRIEEHAPFGPEAGRRISLFHAEVAQALDHAIAAVVTRDAGLAAEARAMKRQVVGLSRDIGRERFGQMHDGTKGTLQGYVREVELVEIFDEIFKLARRIARSELDHGQTPVPAPAPAKAPQP